MVQNRKRLKTYLFVIVLFAFYLFKANDIMLFCFDDGDSKLQIIDFDKIPSNSEVYCDVNLIENIGGFLEKVYFQGWAYCETLDDNAGKQINLIFKDVDSNLAYISKGQAQYRPDVYGVFSKTKNIYNGFNGVELQFSTLKMESGTYKLYTNVIENNTNFGIIDTGLYFTKNKEDFYQEDTKNVMPQ